MPNVPTKCPRCDNEFLPKMQTQYATWNECSNCGLHINEIWIPDRCEAYVIDRSITNGPLKSSLREELNTPVLGEIVSEHKTVSSARTDLARIKRSDTTRRNVPADYRLAIRYLGPRRYDIEIL